MNNNTNINESFLIKIRTKKKATLDLINKSSIQILIKIIFTKRTFFKVLWLAIFFVLLILSVLFVQKAIVEYLSFEYFTSIKTIRDEITPFPALSICNYNEKKISFEILEFKFKSNSYKDKQNEFFEIYNDTVYGQCYRFNGKRKNKTFEISSLSGFNYGLWLQLYAKSENDIGQYIVYIHNQSSTPISIFNKGIFVSSGNYNYFIIKRVFEEQLPVPYNNCYENVTRFDKNKTLINYILYNQSRVYSQIDCIDLCKNLKYMENDTCECKLNSLDQVLDYECKSFNCTLEYITDFQEKKPYSSCNDYCPLECNTYEIETFFFYQDLPSSENISKGFLYPDFKTYTNVSKNFLSLYVYYEDLRYILITQQPKMEMIELVSSIGGLFSLFLGMSFISFFEILEIFLEFFLSNLK